MGSRAVLRGMAHLCDVTFAQKGIKFSFVVLGEPTDLKIALGHRGRVELEVTTIGRTSHGSAPWRGINAVYKMLPVLCVYSFWRRRKALM